MDFFTSIAKRVLGDDITVTDELKVTRGDYLIGWWHVSEYEDGRIAYQLQMQDGGARAYVEMAPVEEGATA